MSRRRLIVVGIPLLVLAAWLVVREARRLGGGSPVPRAGREAASAETTEGGERGEEHGEEGAASLDRIVLTSEALQSLDLVFARAEVRELSPSLDVPAELAPDPDRRATVGARVAGRVVAVPARVGAHVAKGAALVVLESDEIGKAWAEFLGSRARAEVARRAAERARGLLQDRITSQREVEEAEGQLQVAEADLQAARARFAALGLSADDDKPGDNPARVVLMSPISGAVVSRTAYIGQWAEPAETLVEVVDLDELWLLASVYERDMRHVETGQPVQVEVRAYPGEVFHGTVRQVGYTLDERTRTAPFRVVLPNPGHRLKPGMFATARIQETHMHEARPLLAIPWSAVQEVDGHPAVFVRREEGVFELRRIHTGERAGDDVEVLNGLVAGDEVVAEGSFLLKGELLKATLGEEE